MKQTIFTCDRCGLLARQESKPLLWAHIHYRSGVANIGEFYFCYQCGQSVKSYLQARKPSFDSRTLNDHDATCDSVLCDVSVVKDGLDEHGQPIRVSLKCAEYRNERHIWHRTKDGLRFKG